MDTIIARLVILIKIKHYSFFSHTISCHQEFSLNDRCFEKVKDAKNIPWLSHCACHLCMSRYNGIFWKMQFINMPGISILMVVLWEIINWPTRYKCICHHTCTVKNFNYWLRVVSVGLSQSVIISGDFWGLALSTGESIFYNLPSFILSFLLDNTKTLPYPLR